MVLVVLAWGDMAAVRMAHVIRVSESRAHEQLCRAQRSSAPCLGLGPSTLWGLQISGICNDTHQKSLPQGIEGRGLTLRGLLFSEFTGETRVRQPEGSPLCCQTHGVFLVLTESCFTFVTLGGHTIRHPGHRVSFTGFHLPTFLLLNLFHSLPRAPASTANSKCLKLGSGLSFHLPHLTKLLQGTKLGASDASLLSFLHCSPLVTLSCQNTLYTPNQHLLSGWMMNGRWKEERRVWDTREWEAVPHATKCAAFEVLFTALS